jgi:hypothetical protein
MKSLKTFLAEGISPIVYHFTQVRNAADILVSNKFKLTATAQPSDDLAGKKRATLFFLSTTRSKIGHYTEINLEGVVLTLDGRKLMNNYSGKPVDYWGRDFRNVDQKINEMEDRIWHTKQTIPNASKYIKSIHVLVRVEREKLHNFERARGHTENTTGLPVGTEIRWSSDFAKREMRRVWMQAKKRGIPIYFYDKKQNWLAQRKPMELHPDKLKLDDKKKNIDISGKWGARSQLISWVELMLKPANKKLSTKPFGGAKRTLETLRRPDEAFRIFMSDIAGSKTHPDAEKITDFMRKHKIKSYEKFVEYLIDKWVK